jgi:muramoyltetrapeptide carboxypeptidase
MKQWKYLKEGDIVDVIAPSSFCAKKEAQEGVRYLQSLGLQVRYPKDLVRPDFVYANSYENTIKQMKTAFYAKDSSAIWALRGGSGGFRFMEEMLKWKKPSKTKVFVGISDTTFVHLFLNQKWKWPSLHGPMISMLGARKKGANEVKERRDLEKVIFGRTEEVVFSGLHPMNIAAKKKKNIHGLLSGGNLCIVESTLGTRYEPKFNGQIVFLEDIDERGYAIERSLEHMRNAGTFNGVRAVVFGDFVGGRESNGRDLTVKALSRFAMNSNFPVLKGLKSGHGSLVRALPLNTKSTLILSSSSKLICKTGGTF